MSTGNHPTLTRNIAPGVHRLSHAAVNCYLIEDGTAVTLIDAALPATWPHLEQSLEAIGRSPSDVEALVLTHAHPDHMGFAARIAAEWSVPIWVHAADERIAQHPYRFDRQGNPLVHTLRHPRAIPLLTAMVAAGGLRVKGVTNTRRLAPTAVLDVPGNPRVVYTPGHTFGHCALHLPGRGVLFSGDALVTRDPFTAARGPRLVTGVTAADSVMALASLQALADTDAAIVLPGHGEPWQKGARAAVAAAHEAAAHAGTA